MEYTPKQGLPPINMQNLQTTVKQLLVTTRPLDPKEAKIHFIGEAATVVGHGRGRAPSSNLIPGLNKCCWLLGAIHMVDNKQVVRTKLPEAHCCRPA